MPICSKEKQSAGPERWISLFRPNTREYPILSLAGIQFSRPLKSLSVRTSKGLSSGNPAGDDWTAAMACPSGFLNYMCRNPRNLNGQYHISKQNRDEPKSPLKHDGIRAGVYYPRLITDNAPLRPYLTTPFPRAEAATKEVLSLPVHLGLSEEDLGRIVQSVKGFYS